MRSDGGTVTKHERCRNPAWANIRGWPLNCDVLPLNIKGASRFLRKWPSATLDIEPPEALWPGSEAAQVRGHPLNGTDGAIGAPMQGWQR
jgi:hypothetical protein